MALSSSIRQKSNMSSKTSSGSVLTIVACLSLSGSSVSQKFSSLRVSSRVMRTYPAYNHDDLEKSLQFAWQNSSRSVDHPIGIANKPYSDSRSAVSTSNTTNEGLGQTSEFSLMMWMVRLVC